MLQIPAYPESLRTFSSEIGRNKALTQGPGGNTSWKTDEVLWVKASGTYLSSASDHEIFCPVMINNPDVSIYSNGLKPSIEVFLHAYIPEAFVVHVHSVASIGLSVRKYVAASTQDVLGSLGLSLLPYITPGEGLANAIVRARKNCGAIKGFILQNHGLVLWGESIEEVYEDLLTIELMLSQDLSILPMVTPTNLELQQHLSNFKYLTPDHAVFDDLIEKTLLDNVDSWLKDLCWALWASTSSLKAEQCHLLSWEESTFLQTWEKEKWRRNDHA